MFKQISHSEIESVQVCLNGRQVQVPQNITVAALALQQELRFTRTTPESGSKRAPFCMMGVCYECLMVIDGKANQRACATYVKQDMVIDTQLGVGPEMGDVSSE